jgi:hypothetical protein
VNEPGDVVRASEIGQYAFCARAWWLQQVQNIASENVPAMTAGLAGHRAHGRSVVQAERLRELAFVLLTAAAVVAIVMVWVLGAGR